ncbi:M23 family metallopeptidase [Hoeflea ulvae]|uniref:M23 family metallopeptidase n=1 Tax=Hoeflea ulvae TaxID=2983764 RepID=A0ABT3YGZ6_9HYPH|nr:M23 family metallopeptidase [Hoeflea ulvae]MCY0095170.1 M23 family metallopeptidase [Hoeflea ulvae]
MCILVFAVLGIGYWLDRPDDSGSGDEEMTATEVAEAIVPVYVPTIIDLPGDPIRIDLGAHARSAVKELRVPAPLAAQGVSGPLHLVSVRIMESGKRLTLSVPSTQQDFAFFQSQRDQAALEPAADAKPADAEIDADNAPDATGIGEEGAVAGDETGGWGDIQDAGISGADAEFEQTEIQNNTTAVRLIREADRYEPTEDVFVHVVAPSTPKAFLTDNNINLLDSTRVSDAFRTALDMEELQAGSIVAMRQLRSGGRADDRKLVQIAVYLPERFLGALAVTTDGSFKSAVDPWVERNLFERIEDEPQTAQVRVRLLDAVFSTGLRSGVPSSIVGEVIMYLSRKHDLSDFASPEDMLTLVFADTARQGGESAGKVLYVALDRAENPIRCFIFKPADANDFNCFDEHDQTGTISVSNGMVTPVSGGVMTSRFGPRRHPILKKVLMHKGVDWAAPSGTPVRAAYDGTLAYAGDAGGYGNMVKLSHPGGTETRYAHLSRFAEGVAAGQAVKAGATIGYVGTTGRSTGPHLHFEFYRGGTAVNPLEAETASAASDPGAVGQLVDRIVQVESGGNATAKNPLSSATGLGQFIDSTWLRMMRTYRPDLASSLPRDKQLALRFDPTLSREMVANLARENKAYLEAGGHSITAGRLYLAHFLGPEGARIVLSNDDATDLLSLLGSGVISANKFLTGKDVAYIKDWAERKMSGRRGVARASRRPETRSVAQTSPEFMLYRKTLLALLGGV